MKDYLLHVYIPGALMGFYRLVRATSYEEALQKVNALYAGSTIENATIGE